MPPMPSQTDRMLAGQAYLSDDPELRDDRRRCRLLLEQLNATSVAEPFEREEILRTLLGSIGDSTEILSPFQCDYGYRISIGARTFVNFGVVLLDSAEVRVGDDVQIGPGVHLVTPLHPLDPGQRRTQTEWAEPIVVGDGAWLATGVIVCPGVTIGAGAVIGAGSVVTADMPARHLCLGNPCRPVRVV
jgi:maltose O-acetyltransferase